MHGGECRAKDRNEIKHECIEDNVEQKRMHRVRGGSTRGQGGSVDLVDVEKLIRWALGWWPHGHLGSGHFVHTMCSMKCYNQLGSGCPSRSRQTPWPEPNLPTQLTWNMPVKKHSLGKATTTGGGTVEEEETISPNDVVLVAILFIKNGAFDLYSGGHFSYYNF